MIEPLGFSGRNRRPHRKNLVVDLQVPRCNLTVRSCCSSRFCLYVGSRICGTAVVGFGSKAWIRAAGVGAGGLLAGNLGRC